MALIGVLKSLNYDNLSDAEKAKLKAKLVKHQKALKVATVEVERHLKTLSKQKKKRKAKKR